MCFICSAPSMNFRISMLAPKKKLVILYLDIFMGKFLFFYCSTFSQQQLSTLGPIQNKGWCIHVEDRKWLFGGVSIIMILPNVSRGNISMSLSCIKLVQHFSFPFYVIWMLELPLCVLCFDFYFLNTDIWILTWTKPCFFSLLGGKA